MSERSANAAIYQSPEKEISIDEFDLKQSNTEEDPDPDLAGVDTE